MSDHRQTLGQHWQELRWRLGLGLVLFLVAWAVFYQVHAPLLAWLTAPLRALTPTTPMIFTGVGELFFTYLKLSALAAAVTTLPVTLALLWGFVAPGLYAHEKRWVLPLVVAAPTLFVAGAALAFYGVLPLALQFFLSFAAGDLQALPSVREYLSFTLWLLLGFGLAFQLPLVLLGLVRLGVMSAAALRQQRRLAIVIIFIVAAVLTPPDPVSQVLLALPLWLLYELTLWCALCRAPATPEKK